MDTPPNTQECSPQVQYSAGHYSSGSKPGVHGPLCRRTTGGIWQKGDGEIIND